MLILLPPSEGKTAAAAGPVLDLASLSFPEFNPVREQVAQALVNLCRQEPEQALAVLKLSPRQLPEVIRNAHLFDQPTAPASSVYTGVLFEALDYASLTSAQQRRANEQVAIASGLFGLVRPDDLICSYRLSGDVRLPGLPTPKRLWGSALASVADELVIDLRSGAYATLYRSPQWVTVKVMTIRNGRRVPVSHFNKADKGRIARDLLLQRRPPTDPAELVTLLADLGWDAAPTPTGVVEVLTPDHAA